MTWPTGDFSPDSHRTCQLHQGLIAQGDHLLSRCQGWTDDMARQRGWAPEVG